MVAGVSAYLGQEQGIVQVLDVHQADHVAHALHHLDVSAVRLVLRTASERASERADQGKGATQQVGTAAHLDFNQDVLHVQR